LLNEADVTVGFQISPPAFPPGVRTWLSLHVEGLPYGFLKGKALRGGKPLGEVFGFLRQINHGHNLAQSAVNA
jgi:hypothetical protein